MHSFHHSRGRIFFEVFCALAIGASLVGAWMQTGAQSLLAAAALAALYGLVHAFDMKLRKPLAATGVETTMSATGGQGDLLEYRNVAREPLETVEEPQVIELVADGEPKAAKPVAKARKVASPPRKRSRKAPILVAAAEPLDARPPETDHAPVTQLFEPEPALRQMRTVFGRKAG
jgi:hypothetical protein